MILKRLRSEWKALYSILMDFLHRLPNVREAALVGLAILVVVAIGLGLLCLPVLAIQFCFNSWNHAIHSNHLGFVDAIGITLSFVLGGVGVYAFKES
jgi:hypothetical protein